MLDLGVYVFSWAKKIGDCLGIDFMNVLQKRDKETMVRVKNSPDDVDFEVNVDFKENGVKFYLETQMNPGACPFEEIILKLKNGDQIVLNLFVHPAASNGVFIEKADGSV